MVTGLVASCVLLCSVFRVESLFVASTAGNIVFLTLTLSALAGKLQGGTTRSLRLMARRLGLGTEQRALFDLRSRLADLSSEAAIICAASEALRELLPDASASAVATFCLEDGAGGESRKSYSGGGRLAGLEVAAVSESARAALEAALTTGNALGTSVAFACRHATTRGSHLAWSSDFTPGLAVFADWRAASRAGLCGQAVTAPLVAGPACVGFITAHFTASASGPRVTGESSVRVQEFCEIVGSAIYSRRAYDALEASQRVVGDVFPPAVARALEARALREESSPKTTADVVTTVDGPHAPSSCSSGELELARNSHCRVSASMDVATPEDCPSSLKRPDRRSISFRRSWSVDRRISCASADVVPRSSSELLAETFSSVTIIFAGARAEPARSACTYCLPLTPTLAHQISWASQAWRARSRPRRSCPCWMTSSRVSTCCAMCTTATRCVLQPTMTAFAALRVR
jgi:hypothetical protein